MRHNVTNLNQLRKHVNGLSWKATMLKPPPGICEELKTWRKNNKLNPLRQKWSSRSSTPNKLPAWAPSVEWPWSAYSQCANYSHYAQKKKRTKCFFATASDQFAIKSCSKPCLPSNMTKKNDAPDIPRPADCPKSHIQHSHDMSWRHVMT